MGEGGGRVGIHDVGEGGVEEYYVGAELVHYYVDWGGGERGIGGIEGWLGLSCLSSTWGGGQGRLYGGFYWGEHNSRGYKEEEVKWKWAGWTINEVEFGGFGHGAEGGGILSGQFLYS